MTTYLDFEKPIADLQEQIDSLRRQSEASGENVTAQIKELDSQLKTKKKEIYSHLTGWQKVQISRHPERPYSLFYTEKLCSKFIELHGDRCFADDKAIIGGWGEMDGQSIMFIGHQKGINTKMRQYRNFGMANPEGYRKALRLMKLAEKFNKPIVTFIDTPGAYPGLEAEERGQAEAIARNIFEMMKLRVPVICVIIGEGASGGALGIGIGDKVAMLENTWYSVISPESCSSILWRSWDFKEVAADALKLTAADMHKATLVDDIIKEPLGGAHHDPDTMAKTLKTYLQKNLAKLKKIPADERIAQRIKKFSSMGVFTEAPKKRKAEKREILVDLGAMFKKLRSRLHHYLLRKKLKKVNHQTVNYERAKTIVVIFDATLPENLTAAKNFNLYLSGINKRAQFFAFVNHSKPMGSLPFDYMTKQQVNWLFIPEHAKAEELITKRYDLLINLCAEKCLPLEYISALSNATYRVGRFIPEKTYCYDLMINMNGKTDMNYLIEQLNEYLKMIK